MIVVRELFENTVDSNDENYEIENEEISDDEVRIVNGYVLLSQFVKSIFWLS